MKKVIKKIIGALILILFFGFLFISDTIEHGLLITILTWIFVSIITFLLMLAVYFLFGD